MQNRPGVAAAAAAPLAAAKATAPQVRLGGGATDFGIVSPATADATWVADWVTVPASAPVNAWKLTL